MVEKVSGSTIWKYVYHPSGAMLAVVTSGLIKGMVPLPGGGTAIYNGSGLAYIRHKDWLGSSRLATTWAHAVYAKESYAPFGETYNEQGTADRSFTGQDQNVVTGSAGSGVYDYLFRKYDPSAGRWLSPDPSGWKAASLADPKSLNRYAYVENQPMTSTDPEGLACVYASSGGVSVSNWGGDSLDQSVCEQAGGNYIGGYIDPDSIGSPYENGGYSNPNGSGSVSFWYGSGDVPTLFVGGQSYAGTMGMGEIGDNGNGTDYYVSSLTTGGLMSQNSVNSQTNGPQPQHFWQKPGCGSAIAQTAIGVVGIAGEAALIWFAGPEILGMAAEAVAEDGVIAGGTDAGHVLSGVGVILSAPPVLAGQGIVNVTTNCR